MQPAKSLSKATSTETLVKELPHRTYDKAQLILAAGKRGYGKTTLFREYLKIREPRVLALDPFGDFSPIIEAESVDEALSDMAENPGACRRRIVPPINASSHEWANDFFEESIGRLQNCLLVLDEITLWSKSNASTSLTTLVLQGRRLGIRMLVACQRISLVPGVLLSEATDLVLFHLSRPRDLDVVAEWTDIDTAEQVTTLKVGECIHVAT